jgi:rhomboid protease GluP
MANCITCGRQLAPSQFGGQSGVCPTCRASAIDARTGVAPNSGPAARAAAAKWPPVTTILIGINVAVYAAMVLSGVSAIQPSNQDLLKWGADYGPWTLHGEFWRAFTSNYVHGGIIHIGLNMWCLWNLGSLAERIFDRWTYFLTYTACGLAGSMASLWLHPRIISVGASGAIFGMAGALIAALYLGRLPVHPTALRGTLKSLVTFAVYNLLFGAAIPFIDNSAHIGGLLAGLTIGAVLARHLMSPPSTRNFWKLGVFSIAAVLLATAFSYLKRG